MYYCIYYTESNAGDTEKRNGGEQTNGSSDSPREVSIDTNNKDDNMNGESREDNSDSDCEINTTSPPTSKSKSRVIDAMAELEQRADDNDDDGMEMDTAEDSS